MAPDRGEDLGHRLPEADPALDHDGVVGQDAAMPPEIVLPGSLLLLY